MGMFTMDPWVAMKKAAFSEAANKMELVSQNLLEALQRSDNKLLNTTIQKSHTKTK